jgi:hypothetical protein
MIQSPLPRKVITIDRDVTFGRIINGSVYLQKRTYQYCEENGEERSCRNRLPSCERADDS